MNTSVNVLSMRQVEVVNSRFVGRVNGRSYRIGISLVLTLMVALALALAWAAAAHAQSPSDAQYGSPAGPVSGEAGIGPASGSGGAGLTGVGSAGTEALSGRSELAAVASGQESLVGVASGVASSGGESLVGAVLPDTGGSLIFFTALIVVSLAGTGLLVVQRLGSR